MKITAVFLMVVVMVASVTVGNAEVVLTQEQVVGGGTYSAVAWMMSDTGFTNSSDSITSTHLLLQSVTLKSRGVNYATVGELYLKVFEGDTVAGRTYVGVSTNTVNMRAKGVGMPGTWSFDDVLLDKNKIYSYVVDLNNNSTDPGTGGPQVGIQVGGTSGPLVYGYVFASNGNRYNNDPYVIVTAVNKQLSNPYFVQTQEDSGGTYIGVAWKLSDPGFTNWGVAIESQHLLLQSVTLKSRGAGHASTGDLYLKVFEGDTVAGRTYVGVSTNTVNMRAKGVGMPGTWCFDDFSLDKDTVYSYAFDFNTNSTDPGVSGPYAGLKTTSSGPLDYGYLFIGTSGNRVNDDPYVEVGTALPATGIIIIIQ